MRLFSAAAGAKSSAHCFISATANCGVSPPLHFPSRPSLNKSDLSVFHSRYTLFQKKAIAHVSRRRRFVPSAISEATFREESPPPSSLSSSSERKVAVVAWSVVTLAVAVANRVLQKLALVPMKDYPFFLAQLNSFAFVGVFFSVLYVRYRAGITTDEMLSVPKRPFLVIGFLEFASSVCGMYAGAMLPGPAIPLLYQTFLVWQLLFSSLLLGTRYYFHQIMGCFLVAAGVVVAVSRGGADTGMLTGIRPIWPALMIASSVFQAAASIFKESVFLDAKKHLKGKSLDVFVLNSFAAGFQRIRIEKLHEFVMAHVGVNRGGDDVKKKGRAMEFDLGMKMPSLIWEKEWKWIWAGEVIGPSELWFGLMGVYLIILQLFVGVVVLFVYFLAILSFFLLKSM